MPGPYYVTHNAGGGGVGSEGDPFTIVEAADAVAAGDTVYVKASGDYIVEDGSNDCILFVDVVGTLTSPVTWIGYTSIITDGGVVTLDAGDNTLTNCVIANNSVQMYQHFKNFRCTSASGNGFQGDQYIRFDNCRFDNNGGYGATMGYYCLFYKCQGDNNTSRGIAANNYNLIIACKTFNNSDGIWLNSNNTVYNCLSYSNTLSQIRCNSSGLIVIGCSIDGNNGVNTSGIIYGTASGIFIFLNNIIFDCNTGLYSSADFGVFRLSDYNLFYSNNTDRTNVSAGDNDVAGSEDPFTDSGAGDYTLKASSEAEDVGLDLGEF